MNAIEIHLGVTRHLLAPAPTLSCLMPPRYGMYHSEPDHRRVISFSAQLRSAGGGQHEVPLLFVGRYRRGRQH
jgi:hypothetical protein